jgi:hypothetical protein
MSLQQINMYKDDQYELLLAFGVSSWSNAAHAGLTWFRTAMRKRA